MSPAKAKLGGFDDADAASVVVALKKSLGKKSTTAVHLLTDGTALSDVTEWISSGFADLDRVLGGGWAVRRCSQVAGDEGAGKTALAHKAIRECQRQGGIALLLDFEKALQKKKIKNTGIDEDKLIYAAPETMEEGWEIIWAFLKHVRTLKLKGPALIVWDTIAAAIPKAELEGKMDDASPAVAARIMSKGCRKAFNLIAKSRAHLMWVNQYRTKFGGHGWGNGPEKDTTGGRAVKYAVSQSVECIRIKRIKPKQEAGVPPTGYLIATVTHKCRLAPPHRQTEWILDFTHGPSPALTTLHLLRSAKIVRPRGAGRLAAPWLKKGDEFRPREWMERWRKPSFRRGAKAALATVVKAGGVYGYTAARAGDDDEDEDGDDE